MGSLDIYGKASDIWEVFPYMGRLFPCEGSLPMYGKSSHIWEVCPCMAALPIYGEPSHIWGDFPCMESLPMYDMSSQIVLGFVTCGFGLLKILTNTFKTTHCTTLHVRFPHNGSVCV
jgi:hypothetical protein